MKKVKPETEIRNLKSDLAKARLLCESLGCPLLIVYMPDLAIKDLKNKLPRKLTKSQILWIKARDKEFKKLLKP